MTKQIISSSGISWTVKISPIHPKMRQVLLKRVQALKRRIAMIKQIVALDGTLILTKEQSEFLNSELSKE